LKREQRKEKPGLDYILIFIVLLFWITAILQAYSLPI
jgi:hypothetical protein